MNVIATSCPSLRSLIVNTSKHMFIYIYFSLHLSFEAPRRRPHPPVLATSRPRVRSDQIIWVGLSRAVRGYTNPILS